MQTGENEQALRKIIDFTRYIAIVVLILHFYFNCYRAFQELHLSYSIVDRVLVNIYKLPIFSSAMVAKSVAIGLLIISLIGTRAKKDEQIRLSDSIRYTILGMLVYYSSSVLFNLQFSYLLIACSYMSATTIGFLLFLTGVSHM
jgi:hypothetical protein